MAKALQFTTMKSAASAEPLHRSQKLKWDHKVTAFGYVFPSFSSIGGTASILDIYLFSFSSCETLL